MKNTLKLEEQLENIAVAHSIVGGIPESQFSLDQFCNNDHVNAPEHISCGTIGCTLGWLALHPHFTGQGLGLRRGYVHARVGTNPEMDSCEAAEYLFGPRAFDTLFDRYGYGLADTTLINRHGLQGTPAFAHKNDHKKLALARLKRRYYQLKAIVDRRAAK